MLKKRLIPVLFIKNGMIVRSEGFSEHKIIGNVVNEVRRYNEWDIDELVYIDISRDNKFDSGRDDHKIRRVTSVLDVLKLASVECFMPLTFGGGIRDYDTIAEYLRHGADKVVVNTMCFENPEIVKRAVKTFGSQAVVFCLDYRVKTGEVNFYTNNGTVCQPHNVDNIINLISELGCGELLLNSIDKDGSAEGYDIDVIRKISRLVEIPVVACGGASGIFDFEELAGIDSVSGIAAGNMFHFTENAYPRAKKILKNKGYNFR